MRLLGESFDVRARSAVYETLPVGPPQPHYLNAAVRIVAASSAEDVMRELLAIEQRGGRVRTEANRWGARTVDLDLLWGDGLIVSTSGLTVPHPRLTERLFALRPLLDVAPDARDPRTGLPFELPGDGGGIERTSLVL